MTELDFRAWPQLLAQEQDEWREWAARSGYHLLTLDDPRYPPLLREIRDAPPVLFVFGNPEVLSLPQIAIVGTRRPTVDGCEHARAFAAGLSAAGYVVTSGLALGIDAEAHRGTLACKGITVAVLGSGLNYLYPERNQKLARKIAERGAVVTEFMPYFTPQPYNFPVRNRIISGLSHGVLVIEAAENSGSLITARLAAEQGREVFALPGSIRNPMARGCHRLIRQGVKLVESVAEIVEEFPAMVQWEHDRVAPPGGLRPALTKRQKQILQHIAYDAVSVDALLQRAGGQLPELYSNLMQLELGGYIVNRTDGYVLSA